jgi:hypothetical protein
MRINARSRRTILLVASLMVAVVALLAVPVCRYTALGLLHGEPFYRGAPASYWAWTLQRDRQDLEAFLILSGPRGVPSAGKMPPSPPWWSRWWDPPSLPTRESLLPRGAGDDDDWFDTSVTQITNHRIAVFRSDPAAVPVLIDLLKARKAGVRDDAAEALGEVFPPPVEAVPALTTALSDRNPFVRWHAARSLGLMGPAAKEAVPALLDLHRREPASPAIEALRAINPEAAARAGTR